MNAKRLVCDGLVCLGCCLAVGVQGALSAPIIQNINGVFTGETSIVLSGVNFGPPATIISWDDFESGTIGNDLGVPEIGPTWTFFTEGSLPRPHYNNVRSHSGGVSAKVVWNEPGLTPGTINSFGWTEKGPFSTFYISYWRYHDPATTEITGGAVVYNHKQLYTFSEGTGEQQQWMPFMVPAGGTSWATYVQSDPSVLRPYYSAPRYAATCYKWDRWEAYIAWESAIGDNDTYFETWLNGAVLGQFSGLDYCQLANGNSVDDIRIGHMFTGSSNQAYVRSYFDDVYMATSRARVELGNAQQFSACTVREIQIPLQWTAGTIELAPRSNGSFPVGSTAYLFVVDADGVASNGFPVVVGSGGSSDSVPPTVSIVSPTSNGNLFNVLINGEVYITGTASDNSTITRVEWSGSLGGSGVATGTTSWSIPGFGDADNDGVPDGIQLQSGVNRMTISAFDAAGNVGTAFIDLGFAGPGKPGTPAMTF